MFLDDRPKHILEITITPFVIETDGIFYPAFRVSNTWDDEKCVDPITGEINNPLATTTKFNIPCDDENHAMNFARSFATVRVEQIKQSVAAENKRMSDWLASPERQAEIDRAIAYFDAKREKLRNDLSYQSPDSWLPDSMWVRSFRTSGDTMNLPFTAPDPIGSTIWQENENGGRARLRNEIKLADRPTLSSGKSSEMFDFTRKRRENGDLNV